MANQDAVTFRIHHGGKFQRQGSLLSYEGGTVSSFEDIDLDTISFFEIVDMVSKLGYRDTTKIHYLIPGMSLTEGGLRVMADDKGVHDILKTLVTSKKLDIYIEDHVDTRNRVNTSNIIDISIQCRESTSNLKEVSKTIQDLGVNPILNESGGDIGLGLGANDHEIYWSGVDGDIDDDKDYNNSIDDEVENSDAGIKIIEMQMNEDDDGLGELIRVDRTGGSDSEYFDSSEPGSYDEGFSSDDENHDDAVRRKSEMLTFDPKCEVPSFVVGMIFEDKEQFKDAVAKYSIANKVGLKFKKNEAKRIRYVCRTRGCPWVLYASYDNSIGAFMVKTYKGTHNCFNTNQNHLVTTKLLASHFQNRIRTQPNLKAREMKDLVREELGVYVSLVMCIRAKQKVVKELEGNYEAEYAMLWSYAEELRRSNPGSTIILKVVQDEGTGGTRFHRLYICFNACKSGWLAGCRPIIGLDGCFLKGKCKGELLCAVGRDGNNQMFPISWAVVEVERKDSWLWFLHLLHHDLGLSDGTGLTFTSDMQKGLIQAINEIFPRAEHRMCARHIYANWCKKWKGNDLKVQFWKCARASYHEEFKRQLKKLEKLGKGAADDACSYDEKAWSRAYFSTTSKCDIVNNNLSETFNSWILESRYKSIVSMLEEIRVMVMNRLCKKHTEMVKWRSGIAPRVMEKIENYKKEASKCSIHFNGADGYEVNHLFNDRHTVFLKMQQCSCRLWDLTGIPCVHAITSIFHAGHNVEDYVHKWYKAEMYKKTYQYFLQPVRGQNLWPEIAQPTILPPVVRSMPGRPKKKRNRDKDEPRRSTKFSRKGRQMKCSLCKELGHNARACSQKHKEERPAVASQLASGRVQPRPTIEGFGMYVCQTTGLTILNPGQLGERIISFGSNEE